MQQNAARFFSSPFLKGLGLLIVVFLTLSLCFAKLNEKPLARWDEQTNAQVVSQSLRSNHPLRLTLNGQPFLEKPPLWYYTTMFVVNINGSNNASLRFVSALSGIGIIFLTFLLTYKKAGFWAGIISTLILLSTGQLFNTNPAGIFATHTFRSADSDTLMLFFSLASIWALDKGFQKSSRFWILGSFLSGLAVLTKGPLGILPLVTFGLFYLLGNPVKRPKTHDMLWISATFLLTILPWHGWMLAKNGQAFWQTYIQYHLAQRITNTIEGHHEGPWYYLKLLFNRQFFLSAELAIVALIFTLKSKMFKTDFVLFASVANTLIILTIITLTQTKLAWYLLPIYPFLAIMIGITFGRLVKTAQQSP